MEKWADKVIVAVHYSDSSESNRIIDSLKVRDDEGDKLGIEKTLSREDVISDINNGVSYVTAYKSKESTDSESNYSKGKEVIVYAVKLRDYIKTERNEKTEDNLDEIEEF